MTTTAVPARRTRAGTVPAARLLAGGAAAAPVFAAAVLLQGATRDGYDITRHPASLLANGDLGWMQITTFLLTGTLMPACAIGARQVLRERTGRVWGPRLLGVQGAGLVLAGIFPMDPSDGFPVGTPAGVPMAMSAYAVVHNLAGTITFLAMIATCFVLARRFTGARAVIGRLCGALFAVGLVWCYSGGAAGALTLFLGVVTAWSWISATAGHLARNAARS